MADHNATDAVSRRNVLKATGGLLAGSTMLAGLGAGRGATETEEGLQFEIEEANEEVIVANVYVPGAGGLNGLGIFLGHADRFIIHKDENAVSLPEETDGLANPVEMERLDEETYRMYFRMEDIDFSEAEDEEVTLGCGLFTERTMPTTYFDGGITGNELVVT